MHGSVLLEAWEGTGTTGKDFRNTLRNEEEDERKSEGDLEEALCLQAIFLIGVAPFLPVYQN